MINTPNGGDLVRKTNISGMIIQELDSNGEIVRIQEGIPKGEVKMAEEEYVPLELEVNTEVNTEVKVEDVQVVFPDPDNQQIEPEKIPMAEEVKSEETIPIKFVSFREKFLDFEAKADSFENDIIKKMARRVEGLKSFSEVLDKENDYLEEFKNEKLGQ